MAEPVTTAEITELLRRIRDVCEHNVDPRERAAVLVGKADLLARIADERAAEFGPCDYTAQARDVAREAQDTAANALRVWQTSAPASGAAAKDDAPIQAELP